MHQRATDVTSRGLFYLGRVDGTCKVSHCASPLVPVKPHIIPIVLVAATEGRFLQSLTSPIRRVPVKSHIGSLKEPVEPHIARDRR